MNTPVNIETLHAAIKTALAAQFTGTTVDYYSRPGEKIPSPGIMIEMEEIESEDPDDIGTEQTPVMLRFNAYAVLDYKGANKLAVRAMAAAMLHFIRRKRWGCPVGAAKTLGAFPDRIQGKEDDYEVMRVEWEHEALLGVDVWPGGSLPLEVYLGIAPDIGPEHEEDYELIASTEDLPE